MNDVQVSLHCTSNRPELWMALYNSLLSNTVNWELVITGPTTTHGYLPGNFKYIQTDVKPMQGQHIAALNCAGEIICICADDTILSPGCLDKVYSLYKSRNNYKSLIGLEYWKDGRNITESLGWLFENQKVIRLSAMTFMSKQFYLELGGTDIRFIAVQADNELQVRARLAGGQFEICPGAQFHENASERLARLSHEYHSTDRATLEAMFRCNETNTGVIRTCPDVQLYKDDGTLLTVSQGNKGRWK